MATTIHASDKVTITQFGMAPGKVGYQITIVEDTGKMYYAQIDRDAFVQMLHDCNGFIVRTGRVTTK